MPSATEAKAEPFPAAQPGAAGAAAVDRPARLSLGMVAAVILALTLFRLVVSANSGLVFDEGYYTFWSEHLQAGYLDHPPAVAVMIALGRFLAGDNPLGVRVVFVLTGLALSGLIWRTGERLFDRRTALVATLWYNAAPVAGLDFIATPDPPSALFWMATLWAIAEFMASKRRNWWLLAGLMAGLGLCSKYTVAFLAPGLLLFLLADRERRRWLAYWQVWAAALLALLVFSPVLWWNAGHQWASFLFQGRRTVRAAGWPAFLGNFGDFVGGQALYMTPLLCGFALAGILMFLRAPRRPDRAGLALPVLTTLPALIYFCWYTAQAPVDANWLIPLWPPLSLAAAWAAVILWDFRPLLGRLAGALQIALGLAVTTFIYVQVIFHPLQLGNIDLTSQTRGWPGFVAHLENLAAAHQARWIATTDDYAGTGEIASYLLFDHSPLAIRPVDEPLRWTFLPPFDADAAGWPALFVATPAHSPYPASPTTLFGKVQLIDTFNRLGGNGPLESWSVYLVSEPKPAFYSASFTKTPRQFR